ncbi:2Fe-2S iron-sulfur cluster-binding protein [Paenibacillus lutrae]|uniref:2Fe-2S iron-sulfur cluster binding domain-containing protein n=1 Tax=Paenibacillus lutrae TaxID=2078573 RepID=A0A7X3JZI0_9BACL|nr:2Fe-2S iron-sulfur cluster-binding protein [Paenibacillus lutrae]MVP00055.1 2Fe-2S iron-sulfur cluster binding domain-containing protein [Paenibacillus lutrae]
MITLRTRTGDKTVEPEIGLSILELALKNKVEWGFSCTRGTCARCRCFVKEGMELLEAPTEAELNRLEPEEIEIGYRLGCQAVIRTTGTASVTHKPYF